MKKPALPKKPHLGVEALTRVMRFIPQALLLLAVEPGGIRYLQANETALRTTGMSADWYGLTLDAIHEKEEAETIAARCRKAAATGEPETFVGLFPPGAESGKAVCTVCPVPDESGRFNRLLLIVRFPDIAGEEVLGEENEEVYKLLFETASGLVTRLGIDLRILYASPSHHAVLGWNPIELAGEELNAYVHPEDRQRIAAKLRLLLETKEKVSTDYRLQKSDGSWIWMELKGMLQPSGGGESILLVSRDISERKRGEERLSQMIYYDEITGAANLQLFRDRLDQAIRVARRHGGAFALLYLNLDDFRVINRMYGHAAGDRLMKEIVNRMQRYVGDRGSVGRLAGDDFMLIWEDVDSRSDAAEACRLLLKEVAREAALDSDTLTVTASIGVAFYPHDAADVVPLIECAQAAMYRAKDLGKNRCELYKPINE